MRRKKTTALTLSGPRWDGAAVTLFSILLFFAMHLWTEPAAVGLAFIALALVIGRTPWRLARERFCVPVIGLGLFMVVYGLSAIWSPFGGTAVRDFRAILPAFALSAVVLLRFEKRHVRGLLWGFGAVCAVVSLLCTDMACDGPLYHGFTALMEHFDAAVMYIDEIEIGTGRVDGIYSDANVSGSLVALGALVSLYLAQTGKKWWERLLACLLVSVNAAGILLSISRGAILCFGLALLVWLAVAGKGARLRLFLLMALSAGSCAVAVILAMPAIAPGAVLPNLLIVAFGGVTFLVDWAVGERLAGLLGRHMKLAAASAGLVAAVVVAFAAAAFTLTGPLTFSGGSILRGAALAPGEYTLSVEGEFEEAHRIHIYKTSDTEALMGKSTTLYRGPLDGAAFTVPEDSDRVFFRFYGVAGDVLREATLSDGTEIPLNYKLLPEAIASRLHRGLFSDNSYLLRVQFMRDAWVLFRQSPLIGHGLSSTDNMYPAVQPFYYTSRYVHNHVLQVMADQGLLGAVPFLVFLGGVLWLLVKGLRKERDPLAAALVACWVMMNSHALMEINFSVQAYQCAAFVLLPLAVVLYGEPLRESAAKAGGIAVCAVFWGYLAVFGGLLGLRQSVQRESDTLRASSVEQLMSALDSYARRDVFDPGPYRLEYVNTALSEPGGAYDLRMMEYVEKIRASGDYRTCAALLRYYYLPAGDFRGLFACSRECLAQRASYGEVWNAQAAFYRDEVLPAMGEGSVDVFAEGVLAFRDALAELNQREGRLEEIVLTAENQSFVELTASAAELGLSGGELYAYLTSGGTAAS